MVSMTYTSKIDALRLSCFSPKTCGPMRANMSQKHSQLVRHAKKDSPINTKLSHIDHRVAQGTS